MADLTANKVLKPNDYGNIALDKMLQVWIPIVVNQS